MSTHTPKRFAYSVLLIGVLVLAGFAGLGISSSPSEKHGWRVFGGMMGPVQ